MVRLIVQDGKAKKSYKVQRGLLSIGSGQDVKLRLAAPNVAARHAELEITDDGAILRPTPGAATPKVNGQLAKGETQLSLGDQVWIGNARITLQSEDEDPDKVQLKPGAVRARRSSRPGGRRRTSTGLPARAVVGIALLVALGLFLGGWKLFESVQTDDPDQLLGVAEQMVADRNRGRVEQVLARLPARLSPEQQARVEGIRAGLANLAASSSDNLENIEGHKFFDGKLKRYLRDHLPEGEAVNVRKVRYFLELCADFRAQWPRHPELTWVEAKEKELAQHGSRDRAPSWDQLDWCVKNWTGGSPKRYRDAYRLLKQFEKDCQATDCEKAAALRDTLDVERDEYFEAKRSEAQAALDEGNGGRAVYWLTELVINIGDESLEDRAAKALLQIRDLEGYLQTMRRNETYRFRQLVKEAVVRDFAKANGVI